MLTSAVARFYQGKTDLGGEYEGQEYKPDSVEFPDSLQLRQHQSGVHTLQYGPIPSLLSSFLTHFLYFHLVSIAHQPQNRTEMEEFILLYHKL